MRNVESGPAEPAVLEGTGHPVPPPADPDAPAAAEPGYRTHAVTLVAVVLAAAMTVWHAVVMLRGYFWQDDFLYVYRAATQPLLEYVLQNYNGHAMPGQFLLVWLVTRWAPLNWPSVVLPLIALQVLAYVLFWRLLVRLFGVRPEILLPFAVVVVSPLAFIASNWWAYALQLVPFQVALAGALHAHVRYLQTGNRRDAVAGVLWTVGGLLFWEKALFIVPVAFAVTIALTEGGLVWRLMAAWSRHRRLWIWYAVVVVAYVSLYVRTATEVESPPVRGQDVGTLAERMLFDTFLPGVLGGPWRVRFSATTALDVPPIWILVASAVLAAAVVAVGLWVGRTRAVVAWALLLGYLACEVGLVAAFRLHFIRPIIGQDVRYVADAVPIAALCGALAFWTPVRSEILPPAPRPGRSTIAALALGVVFIIGATVTMAAATPHMDQDYARSYVRNATQALRDQPGTVLYDGSVPADLMIGAFGDDARVSRVIGPLALDIGFDQPTGDLRILDDTGTPQPVTLPDPLTAPTGPVRDCGYLADRHGVDVTFSTEPQKARQVLRIGYYAGRSVVGAVIVGDLRFRVTFVAGVHRLFITVQDPTQIVSIDLGDTETAVCVTDVVIGSPRPGAG
jgi:hypothetical protein